MPSAEDAAALKQKGNKAFAEHDWATAVDFYTQAIEANDQDPSFYCNRAQVGHASVRVFRTILLTTTPYTGKHQIRIIRVRHS